MNIVVIKCDLPSKKQLKMWLIEKCFVFYALFIAIIIYSVSILSTVYESFVVICLTLLAPVVAVHCHEVNKTWGIRQCRDFFQ